VDLARLAGLTPAGVICEIMNDDGTMARVPQLVEFCRRHGLKMISVADLDPLPSANTKRYIRRVGEGCIETEFGPFRTYAYTSDISPEMHMALIRGEVEGAERVLVRMHSHCVYGDVFGSTRCDCQKLIRGFPRAHRRGRFGVLVYLHQTGPVVPYARKLRPGWIAWCPTAATSCTIPAPPANSSCSTKAASARRFFPIWACTPSAC